jgi:hypothetical protein
MYTKVESRFWDDEKLKPLDDDSKLLALFFLTTKHRNIIGMYIIPSVFVTHCLKWSEERFREAFTKLLGIGFIKYDEATEIVFITNFLSQQYNPIENPNQIKAAIEKTNELPLSPLFEDLIAALHKHFKPFYKPLVERLQERLGQGFGKPVLRTPYTVEEKVTVIRSIGDNTRAVDNVDIVDNSLETGKQDFTDFWNIYPRREGIARAQGAWENVIAEGVKPLDLIIAAGKYAIQVAEEKTEKRFMKMPHTFITEKVFRDYLPAPPPPKPDCSQCPDRDSCQNGMIEVEEYDEQLKGTYMRLRPCPQKGAS